MPDILEALYQVAKDGLGADPCLIDDKLFKLSMTFKKEIEMPELFLEDLEEELDQEDR